MVKQKKERGPGKRLAKESADRTGQLSSRSFALGLLIVLVVAAGVRLYGLGEPDFWLDELHSMANSAARRVEFETPILGTVLEFSSGATELTGKSTWSSVWRGMRDDSHPPTYFLLLQSWRRLVGDGEFAVRLLATLFSVLSLVPVALMLRAFGLPRQGLAAAAFLAVAFTHIRYAQDNRPYSLAMLLLGISFWTFARGYVGWDRCTGDRPPANRLAGGLPAACRRRERWAWATLYGLASYLAVMTHYFTGAALVGHAVLVATHRHASFRRTWTLTVAATLVAFGLTWGPALLQQWEFIANQDWLRTWEPDHALRTVLRMADLPIRLLFWHEPFTPAYLPSVAGAVLLGGTLIALRLRTDAAAKLFAVWYFMPLLLFATIDLTTDMRLLKHLRYTSIAAPGLVGLIVLAVFRIRGIARWSVIVALGLATASTLHLPTPVNPRGRRAAKWISQVCRPGDLLIFEAIDWPPYWARHSYQIAAYYLPQFTQVKPPVALIREPPDSDFQEAISAFPRLIIVSPRAGEFFNPVPGVFRHVNKTGYVRLMGEVHVLERIR